MASISSKQMDRIKKEVEKEFPHDEALQQVHIARKILAKEAEQKGLGFFEYIRSLDILPNNLKNR
jgi:hypothetical protein